MNTKMEREVGLDLGEMPIFGLLRRRKTMDILMTAILVIFEDREDDFYLVCPYIYSIKINIFIVLVILRLQ